MNDIKSFKYAAKELVEKVPSQLFYKTFIQIMSPVFSKYCRASDTFDRLHKC